MDASQNFQLSIIQGATFMLPVVWYYPDGSLVNLSGYTARMVFRATVEDTGTPIMEASTQNGFITINGLAGQVNIAIPSSTTSALTNRQTMAWSLFLTSGTGIVTSLLSGSAIVQGSTI